MMCLARNEDEDEDKKGEDEDEDSSYRGVYTSGREKILIQKKWTI